jgi:uridine kinase
LDAAVSHLLPRLSEGSRLVLIDGPSGAGKSTLARLLRDRALAVQPVVLLSLDDVYPGWDGLDDGAREIATSVVVPLAAGRAGRWRRYDWSLGTKAETTIIEPGSAVIIEGVGALHPDASPLASGRVWVDAPTPTRKHRALARDGDGYSPYWDRWAAQEAAYIKRTRPQARADLVFHTSNTGKGRQ